MLEAHLSQRKPLFQVAPETAANISQVLPSTSRQAIQVQPRSAGKISSWQAIQVESKSGGEILQALPSPSSLRLREDQNLAARLLQIPPSTSRQMPLIETDSTDNILQGHPCPKGPMLKKDHNSACRMSQMLPSSQVAEVRPSASRQEAQFGTDSKSSICQVLPSRNGLLLQDDPEDLFVHELAHPGGKLVKIGSKSYFVVEDHSKRGRGSCEKRPRKLLVSEKLPEETKKHDS